MYDATFLTVRDVAHWLGVNQDTVRRWLRERKLSGRYFGGRTGYRITARAVQQFLEGQPERSPLSAQ